MAREYLVNNYIFPRLDFQSQMFGVGKESQVWAYFQVILISNFLLADCPLIQLRSSETRRG